MSNATIPQGCCRELQGALAGSAPLQVHAILHLDPLLLSRRDVEAHGLEVRGVVVILAVIFAVAFAAAAAVAVATPRAAAPLVGLRVLKYLDVPCLNSSSASSAAL